MLDNTELIETLDETKSKATEVSEKLAMAAKTSADIDKLRDGYVLFGQYKFILILLMLLCIQYRQHLACVNNRGEVTKVYKVLKISFGYLL